MVISLHDLIKVSISKMKGSPKGSFPLAVKNSLSGLYPVP